MRVRIPTSPLERTHPEPHSEAVEQFLAMLKFEQRDKLAELPNEIMEEVRDDCIVFTSR